ncbi:MAG: threonine/serine exporter family protein [Planctomycetota bacterium]
MVAAAVEPPATEPHNGASATPETQNALLVAFARLLAMYGTPAHRVETALAALASRWGLRGSFFATPTAVFAEIEREGETTSRLIRVEPAEVRLDRLVQLDDTLERTLAGELAPDKAITRVREIETKPALYGATQTAAAFGLMGAAAAVFFGGGVWGVGLGLLTAMMVGTIAMTAGRSGRIARVSEFLAGLASALLASVAVAAMAHHGWGVADAGVVSLAGLIVLLPGLTITISVSELASRNMVAGSARLVSAATALLSLGFGAAIGARGGTAFVDWMGWAAAAASPTPLPEWALLPALLSAAVGLTVVFHAPFRALLLFALVGGFSFGTARFCSLVVGPELAAFLAALAIGVVANIYARACRRPTALVTMPGIILLVPGSMGFRSISSFMSEDAVGGVQTAFGVFLVATAIVMGLLLANAAVHPRRVL